MNHLVIILRTKIVSIIEHSTEPIIDATKIQTTYGYFLKLLYLQQAVMDYDKEELVQAKIWDDTYAFFVAKNFEDKDN